MKRFTLLSLRNFLSYGNNTTTFNLNVPGTTLILGEDLDNTANGMGANGVGKFQSVDSMIKTPSGWVRMGDIQCGQVIQMPDGSGAPVTGIFPQGIQQLYRITFADGRSTLAGGPHLWTVFSHRWGKQGSRGQKIVTTNDLIVYLKELSDRNNKPWYNMFVPTVVHPDTLDKCVPIDPYLLGVLLGDGGMTSGGIKLTSADQEIVNVCSSIMEANHNQCLKQVNVHTNNGYDWTVCNKDEFKHKRLKNSVKSGLKDLGLYGCKSNTKFIPVDYLEGTSKQQKLALLAGLMDTDGTVNRTKNVSFCSTSEQLAKDVQYIIRSLGGKATITTRSPFYRNQDGNKVHGLIAYNVSIRYSHPRELFRLKRKQQLLSQGATQYSNEGLRVVSIDPAGEAECQCIMVDHPDHLYITDDFIVTHNTTLINALSYALYDKPVSNISKDKLINNINQKNMEVSCEWEEEENGTLNVYKVVRTRKTKGGAAGNNVYFYKNEEDKTLDSAANTNTLIESIIGMPHEMFVRIVVFSAGHTPFLDLPSRAQADLIEGLFGVTEISAKADILKTNIKDTEARLTAKKLIIDQAVREQDRHNQLIISANGRVDAWDMQTAASIIGLKTVLKAVESVDVEQQRSLKESADAVLSQMATVDTEIATKKRYLHTNDTRQKKIVDELTHLRDAKCPYCLQQFVSGADKIEALSIELETLVGEAEQLSNQILESTTARDVLFDELNIIKSNITVDDIAGLMKLAQDSSSAQVRIDELESADNPHLEPLQELLDITFDEINYDEVNTLTKELEHQKFLLKLLTKSDSFVRKALLNRYIPYLNTQLQTYLEELGLPHRIQFTHTLTAEISRFGQSLDFGQLSAGQKARVNFALSLAFKDVLQRLHATINVCMLDEVLDHGLDSVGVQSAAKLVKRKARDEELSMFIVSHKEEVTGIFDRTMTVQMNQGFSNIKEEIAS